MPLVDKVNGYDIAYKWFDYLKALGHSINAFVPIAIGIPNHGHAVKSFIGTKQNINSIIGNGKRFMACEIIKWLKENNQIELLNLFANAMERKLKANNKKHEVWELSFDWKHCSSDNLYNR